MPSAVPSARTRKIATCGLLLTCALAGVATAGCGRLKQRVKASMDNNAEVRQGVVDSARTSCVQAAMAKAPKLPGVGPKIESYCDCFATKGLGNFSNSELAGISLNGGHFTPEQQKKLGRAVQMCIGVLRGPSPAPRPQ